MSSCLLPCIEGIIIRQFCIPATIESFNIWLSAETKLVLCFRRYWVQREICVEKRGKKYKSASGRKYKWWTWPVVPFTCCKITNIVGNPMQETWHGPGRKSKWKLKIHLKSQWQLPTMSNPSEKMSVHKCGNVISRNTVSKNEEIRLGDMPPERWRNWRVGVRGPQWPCEIFQMVSKWQNLKLIHDWIQFRWAF